MLSSKLVILWPLLLLAPSVICRSFVTKVSSENGFWKRDTTAVQSNSTKPDIYSFDVTSNITYRYAVTTVSSRVANPANTSKEISFHVTLPESAFISKFLMVIKDKTYEAYVKEKEEAKKDYQDAVDHGFTAGLVSMNARDSNVFTVSVNVEANGKVTFNLTYEQLLTRTLGQYENIINVDPGQIVKLFNVNVNIAESSNITNLQVSDLKTSNEIDSKNTKNINAKITRPSQDSAKISWSPDAKEQQELSADGVSGQFIVRYDVDHSAHPNQILVDEGYFVHFYSPTDLKTLPKHVLFVLDISGSMGGRKIEQLREALTLILADIGEGDYFSILLFSDAVQLWTLNGTVGDASPPIFYDDAPSTQTPEIEINHRFIVPATPQNIKKATEFAKTIQETGGTNVIAGIRKSLEIAKWGQKQPGIKAKPLVIFLTDGQPNVEMSDPDEINKSVIKLNPDKYPIFSLAFGQGADFEFLRKLSLSNAGFARNIYVASDTTLQLKNFYKEVASPLLSNVTFEYIPGQIADGYVTKRVFSNLYNGSELVVAGKLSGSSKALGGNMTYEGVDGHFCIPIPTPFDIPAQKPRAHLEKLFAFLYIKELLDKDLISDEKNSTYKQKALKLSLEYGFVTPLTSLVVVKPNETESGASIKNSNAVPTESAGLSSFSYVGAPPAQMAFPAAGFPPARPAGFLSIRSFVDVQLAKKANFQRSYLQRSFAPLSNSLMNRAPVPMSYNAPIRPKIVGPLDLGGQSSSFSNSFSGSSWSSYRPKKRPSPMIAKSSMKRPSIKGYAPPVPAPLSPISTTFHQEADIDSAFAYSTTTIPVVSTVSTVSEVPTVDANTTAPIQSYNLSQIAWLQNKTEIKFPNSNNSYSVFVGDLPNIEYQSCMIPNSNNTLGHCRHLAHCIIPQILSSFTDFIPYGEQCVIDARFVGICCPKQYAQKLESTTAPSSTPISTLAPSQPTTTTA